MNSIILSPIGTSVFTKGAYPKEISQYSNRRTLDDLPSGIRGTIDAYIAQTREILLGLSLADARIRSAELNGIIQFYDNKLRERSGDIHYLLPSDTYIGRKACDLIEEYLHCYFEDIRILEISDLQTADCETFQYALSDLTGRIMHLKEGLLPAQKLIFNLTGGFKSILGFLQSLGMFYADETVYVFEFSDSLMRIPALPVKLEPYPFLLRYATVFRRLNNSLRVDEEDYRYIPNSLVLNLFGEPTLSAYGKIVWDSFRKELYSREMLESISPKIVYSARFRDSSRNLIPDAYYRLNRRIDDLSVYLEGSRKNLLRSLDLKKLRVSQGISTHEIDAWADGGAKRIFCHYEADKLVLDVLAEGLH